MAKNITPGQQQKMAAIQGRKHERSGLCRFFKSAIFLLLNPKAPSESPGARGVGNSSFYPNPAAAITQLEYEVKKAGPESVDLLEKDGNKLRTLLAETQQEKSRQRQELDLSDLPARTSVKPRLKAARKPSGL